MIALPGLARRRRRFEDDESCHTVHIHATAPLARKGDFRLAGIELRGDRVGAPRPHRIGFREVSNEIGEEGARHSQVIDAALDALDALRVSTKEREELCNEDIRFLILHQAGGGILASHNFERGSSGKF
jgi:hypothetical protein